MCLLYAAHGIVPVVACLVPGVRRVVARRMFSWCGTGLCCHHLPPPRPPPAPVSYPLQEACCPRLFHMPVPTSNADGDEVLPFLLVI